MKRNRVRMGDVFYMKIDEDKYAYGQVITEEYPHLLVFFRFLSDHPLADVDAVLSSEVWFKAFTFNECLREGIWVKIGNCTPNYDFPLPVFKIGSDNNVFLVDYKGDTIRPVEPGEENEYSYRKYYTPNVIEGTIQYFCGVGVEEMTEFEKKAYQKILSGADMKQP